MIAFIPDWVLSVCQEADLCSYVVFVSVGKRFREDGGFGVGSCGIENGGLCWKVGRSIDQTEELAR